MSVFVRCDRCRAEMSPPRRKAGELYIVAGTRQGLLGPIPAIADLCQACTAELAAWMRQTTPA